MVSKPSQKLIILPPNTNNDQLTNGTSNLKQTNTSTNTNTSNINTNKNGIVSNSSGELTSSHLQKLYMYKTTASPNQYLDSQPSNNTKNLKILNTPIGSPSNTNKIILNVSNSTFKLTQPLPSMLQQQTVHQVETVTLNGHHNHFSENNENNGIKRKLSASEDEITPTNKIMINKNTTVFSEKKAVCSPKSPSTTVSSPPNWSETNLQFIKEMLAKLNNNISTTNDNDATLEAIDVQTNDEKLRKMCENVKEKLEKNAYESIEDLNLDIDSIKEKCSIKIKQNGIIGNESCRRIKLVKIQNMSDLVATNDDDNNNTSKESHNV
jgi:hypothetical protein